VSLFSDAIASGQAILRAEAEARMKDTCKFKVESGRSDPDPQTGAQTPTYTYLHSGQAFPCRIKVYSAQMLREQDSGGRTVVETVRELHIPWDAPSIPAGARVEMTSVHASSDPTLAGGLFAVTGPAAGSQTNARRLQITEVVS